MMQYFARLKPGDWTPIRGPAGPLVIKNTDTFSGISMFAHGVGLTPMLQMLRYFLSRDDSFPIWLLYFNHADQQVLLKDELEKLSTTYTRFNLRYMAKAGKHWEDLRAEDLVPSLPFQAGAGVASLNDQDTPPAKIFVCGPKSFVKKTQMVLQRIGHQDDVVHLF